MKKQQENTVCIIVNCAPLTKSGVRTDLQWTRLFLPPWTFYCNMYLSGKSKFLFTFPLASSIEGFWNRELIQIKTSYLRSYQEEKEKQIQKIPT